MEIKALRFYFDIVSPYAYLAFEQLPRALAGLSCSVQYQPVLFAGLLAHWGTKGPAELAPKRDWTYRQVLWLARRHGIRLELPAAHPFNPLPQLRMLVARGLADPSGLPNRRAVAQAFAQVWQGAGAAADDPQRLAALEAALAPPPHRAAERRPADAAEVKDALRAATAAAAARGVFGVPTVEVDGLLFFGLDALPMLADYLEGGEAAQALAGDRDSAAAVGAGVVRRS
jgi:2-hydroxychromene-2-carboxylate isomerase